MIAAIVGLFLVTGGFLMGVWAVFYGILVLLDMASAMQIAFGITVMTLLTIGYLEYTHLETIERLADAQPVDRETAPELYKTATRVAAQLDIPVPTIAISERTAPEALAVGFRPENIHLVLSLGAINTLSKQEEMEAVIAHELAHVKNRDAMVITVVSLPIVLADGLRSRILTDGLNTRFGQLKDMGWGAIITIPLAFLSNIVWTVGRAIMARFSRTRELAADRSAVEVTGSPIALASALKRLDQEISETPERDLREVSGVSSLSILPLEPRELEKVMLGPEGDIEPSYWWLRKRLHRFRRWLFTTHPPTEERLEMLAQIERNQ
ncbi:M48 family metallopeptidase [Haladaptatus caseinilyticus]|uniref:M48 family metallopeptidase n=1 Tax=Haladaptatus caseinilyticus TaxID=2993314 RepID=UPI00224AB148|nr:M48 family metalloprotease [Haladaptatus caseinilyticus]